MKKFRKLIPALALLLVSAVLMSTASYAWFSMNNKVTVNGMEVKTKVSSNLLIAEDGLGATAKKDDSLFKSTLTQTVKGILEPVSTADAINYFYTIDALANGQKDKPVGSEAFIKYDVNSAAIIDSTAYTDLFSETYGVSKTIAGNMIAGQTKAVPYVDYVFQLKATNSGTTDQIIALTKLDLTYAGVADASKAHRIAVFVQDITEEATSSADPTGRKGIYKVESSANFNNQVVDGTASYASAEYVGSAVTLATVNPGTRYYKVVVRMWLEGQDNTCNNSTFMPLSAEWALDIELSLVDSLTGVTYINKVVTPAP